MGIMVPKIEPMPSLPFELRESPLLRRSSSRVREFDGPLGSRTATTRETHASSHASMRREVSVPGTRLSTGRSRRSSMNDLEQDNESSSSYSRSVAVSNGTNKSSTLSRRHSSEVASSKSVCHRSSSRGKSASATRHLSGRSNKIDAGRSPSCHSRSNSTTRKMLEPKSSTRITSSKSVCRNRSPERSERKSNKQDAQRSHSSDPRASNAYHGSSSKSLGRKSSSFARRHSAEVTTSKSDCNSNLNRHDSAPSSRQLPRRNSYHHNVPGTGSKTRRTNKSTSSEEEDERSDGGRSLSTSRTCTRGRSKLRDDDKSIFSAGRSFANSLTRRRSLSRSASKVLKTTSTMDGGYDVEPCTQRYELPFNPSTGACNYHPEYIVAVKNSRATGGWKIISDDCPKCRV